jgi:predicted ribosome quality control (RQC) complex YloA/Tae2 family protein
MDRFFLRALVREVAPRLLGRRARSHHRWGGFGFAVLLGTKRGLDIVVSLSPQAPGFYLGRPPVAVDEAPDRSRQAHHAQHAQQARFKKLLSGAEIIGIKTAPLDRVVTVEWRYTKPSGARRLLELVLEWPGTRTSAFLVDSNSREVLDVISPGTPRAVAGEIFEPLRPPPGSGSLAASAKELEERLAAARREGLSESRALGAASGLSPLLVKELTALVNARLGLEAAFKQIVARLGEPPRPVLLRRSAPDFERSGPDLVLSPIVLSPRKGWTATEFGECNEAAAAFVTKSYQLGRARAIYLAAATDLRRRLKKLRALRGRLSQERDALQDPGELRRWGELLLAGLRQAKRADGEVMVPDPYHADSPLVRVPIDPRLDLTRNARRYFGRARKAIRSRAVLEDRLGKLGGEIDYLETLELGLTDSAGGETLDLLVDEMREAGLMRAPGEKKPTKRKKKRGEPRLEPRRFRLPGGAVVLAGRSARSNEELTFGIAGAHVVLRVPPGEEVGRREIEQSAAVAAYLSKARASTAAEVHYTPRKNVRKIPGAPPGTVRLSQFKTVRVRPALPESKQA